MTSDNANERILEVELGSTDPAVWAVRSESPTVYLVDARQPALPRVLRLTSSESPQRGAWDDMWAPLELVTAGPLTDEGWTPIGGSEPVDWMLRVGSRHKSLADPFGGSHDYGGWISRRCLAIDKLTDEALNELLASHE